MNASFFVVLMENIHKEGIIQCAYSHIIDLDHGATLVTSWHVIEDAFSLPSVMIDHRIILISDVSGFWFL